jgi:hypothetical protein
VSLSGGIVSISEDRCSGHIFDSVPLEEIWYVIHACYHNTPHLSLVRESSSNLVARVYKDGK